MEYEIKFNFEISDNEGEILEKVLGSDNGKIMLDNLNLLAKTAISEYIDMITNQGIPSRNNDLKTKRLLFLIENYYPETLPTEFELINLFRINERSAKALIDDTLSLYQNRIETNLDESIKRALKDFTIDEEDNYYEGVVESKVLLDKINENITREKPGLESLKKKRNTSGKYICKIDTYKFLEEKYLILTDGEDDE